MDATDGDVSVLAGEEGGEVGRVARVDEDGDTGPDVLHPLRRPRLWCLGANRVTKQNSVHHVQARTERIVVLSLTAPRVQPERAVPLQ